MSSLSKRAAPRGPGARPPPYGLPGQLLWRARPGRMEEMTVPLDTVNDIRSMDAAGRSRSEIARVLHVSRPSRPGGRGRSRAATPTSSSTASTSSAAGECPTRTWPCCSSSASTPPATRRSSAAPRGTPSPRSPGASSSPGSRDAGSPACGSSPATSARGCSVRSRSCSPGLATIASRCISTATCWEGFP